jgi:hypothetical protein
MEVPPELAQHEDPRFVIRGRFSGDETSGAVLVGGTSRYGVAESRPVAYWPAR